MKRVLLDTNAYCQYLEGHQGIRHVLEQAEIILMSVFVLGELYSGFRGGTKERQNLDWLNQFMAKPTVQVIEASTETAEFFAEVKDALKRSGNPIPMNDVWIAAHSMEMGAVLVTSDNHFKKVAGLRTFFPE